MKRILIVYNEMVIGGSTTSLLSILSLLDYTQYQIDLLLKRNEGELLNDIPAGVNVLPAALPNIKTIKIRKALSPICLYNYLYTKFNKKKLSSIELLQICDYDYAKISNQMDHEYEIAISFLEFWPLYYTANRVRAKRKIAWIHVDYIGAGFVPKIDRTSLEKFERIVVVAKSCIDSIVRTFPQFSTKTICIENILSAKVIKKLSCEPVDFQMNYEKLNISTVCRIAFEHKGLDRALEIFRKLNDEKLCNDVNWFIIGNGPDYKKLEGLIQKYGLENHIFLLGSQGNPYKYIKESDLFFLPSRYEGKPMAVTEAMMLGIPSVVAEYSSAREQIEDGIDGIILRNDDESIYQGLKMILLDRSIIASLKNNVKKRNYSNLQEFSKIISLIDNVEP